MHFATGSIKFLWLATINYFIMKTINNEVIRSLTPCYDPSKYVTDENETLTVFEWVEKYRGTVPDEDIIWLLCHKEFLSNKELRLFAVWCAREALKLIDNPDSRSIEACNVAERYANGEATHEELEAAHDDACAAYDDLRTTAAEATTRNAADAANATADAADAAVYAACTANSVYAANAEVNAYFAANAAAKAVANAAANIATRNTADAAFYTADTTIRVSQLDKLLKYVQN